MVRFWDTSALVPLCLDEPQTAAMQLLQQQDPDIITWWGTRIECISSVRRRVREGRLTADAEAATRPCLRLLFETVDEVVAAEDVRVRAERLLAIHPLRAADALQLGAALIWVEDRPAEQAFVSLDDRLRDAARREGFTVSP